MNRSHNLPGQNRRSAAEVLAGREGSLRCRYCRAIKVGRDGKRCPACGGVLDRVSDQGAGS